MIIICSVSCLRINNTPHFYSTSAYQTKVKPKCRNGEREKKKGNFKHRFCVWRIVRSIPEWREFVCAQLLRFGSLSCCMTPDCGCWTDGLTSGHREDFMIRSETASPAAAQRAPLTTPPPPCLTFGGKCLC